MGHQKWKSCSAIARYSTEKRFRLPYLFFVNRHQTVLLALFEAHVFCDHFSAQVVVCGYRATIALFEMRKARLKHAP